MTSTCGRIDANRREVRTVGADRIDDELDTALIADITHVVS